MPPPNLSTSLLSRQPPTLVRSPLTLAVLDSQVLGFVHFHRTEDAIACKEALDGSTSHLGHNLKIQYQERGNNERCGTLRVHNLPPEGTSPSLSSRPHTT